MQNNKNILLATILSMVILLGWTWFYEKPRIEQKEKLIEAQRIAAQKQQDATPKKIAYDANNSPKMIESKTAVALKAREQIIVDTKFERVRVESENLHGSLNLRGASFDDLTLAKYYETTERKKEVVLFAPKDSKERYFADFGWVSSDANLDLPKADSLWRASSSKLTPKTPITLSWQSRQGLMFYIDIAMDENFMFNIKQRVVNYSGRELTLAPYGRVNRILNIVHKPVYILHEGPIGVFKDVLQEPTYKDIAEEKNQAFDGANGGWLGITDKYWLSALIPDKSVDYRAEFSYNYVNQNQVFNSEFIGQEFKLEKKSELVFEHHLFAGAKQVGLLDKYSKDYDIKLFDRAVDFGWFYFITKPFFFAISFLNKFLGNFGLAILAMTVIIKLLLLPLANKSYAAIAKMKNLQPKIEEIRKKFKDDKVAMNREMMEFYKREKVNPASGCLPILIQIPIFFSLYKVIYVTLDMRQAPFYGWVQDLSAPDPTSIFNLFGLLPYEVSGILIIGAWPILMGITMMLQQKLSPQIGDPTQAKVLKFMPYVLTVVLASFPAGLVIYWTWNNLLSIAQQLYISNKVGRKK